VNDLLEPGGGLASAIPHYEDRPGQRQMSAAVAYALEERRGLIVEAGTGIGKTLAYLIPALESGQRVVVSTGTRALQDQIARNDLPLLREIVARPFAAVVLKGVSNYVCKRKLAELKTERRLVHQDDDRGRDRRDDRGILDWAAETATGDRAEVEWIAEDDPWWGEVTTTSETRLAARCPFFNQCFVTTARRAAEKANLILVNHHLYFADLAIRASGGTKRILPEHEAVIFDEAHQLEDVATEHFGVRFSSVQLGGLLRDAQGLLGKMALWTGGEVAMPLRTAERASLALFASVRAALLPALTADGGSSGDGRVTLPPELFEHPDRQRAWFELDAALEEIARAAESESEDGPDESISTAAARGGLGQLAFRARTLRDALALVAEQRQASYVYWGEARSHHTALTASPIRVAELLARHVVRAGPTPIFTSATLSTGGRLDYTRRRLGLPVGEIDELIVESPFDYGSCAQLYVPRDLPMPDDPAFTAAAAARIRELVALTGGGAFVLCTSLRSMAALAAALVDLPHPRWVQGEAPRGLLLDRFRSTPGSVLFGCGSFWEGVDVPGEALRLVIIDRLPFTPHVDPLQAARMRNAAEAGVDPFAAIQLPEAAIALKQGFGRLIRRSDDRGIVAILDVRAVTRSYGRVFFETLPAKLPRTSSLEQVKRWWQGPAAGSSAAGSGAASGAASAASSASPGERPRAPRRAPAEVLSAAQVRSLVETLAARAGREPLPLPPALALALAPAPAFDPELDLQRSGDEDDDEASTPPDKPEKL
jgi:ATP-dependent DNA helicase DinG